MNLLVTGGLGFIGSNFILHVLTNYNHNIVNVDSESFGSNSKSLEMIEHNKNYRFVKGNINDQELMNKLIEECEVIVNFAAESHVDRSITNAKPFLESNITGVFTILEILKKQKKKLIQISTDEVFGSIINGSTDEKSRLNPSTPYSSTKAAAELLVNSYVTTYGVDALITRCTNNYGPRQFPEKLIPKTIVLADKNLKVDVYGNGNSRRDWIFVEDHCEAIMKVLQNGKRGESYNVSSYNEINTIEVVKTILALMNKPEDLFEFVEERPGEDYRYCLDSSKIRSELGWKPKINFKDGVKLTIDWYLQNRKWWKDLPLDSFKTNKWSN